MLNNSEGVQFIGKAHVGDYKRYVKSNMVDLNMANQVYDRNVYSYVVSSQNRIPTARIWSPDPLTQNKFNLVVRI